MSSTDTTYANAIPPQIWATLNNASIETPVPTEEPAAIVAAPWVETKRKPRKSRTIVISRSTGLLLLRFTLRAFMLCCALYALYTLGLYLLFRDRLFYSLFIARGLML